VAVLPEAEDVDGIEAEDLRIEVSRAAAGGQGVNTTDSVCRFCIFRRNDRALSGRAQPD